MMGDRTECIFFKPYKFFMPLHTFHKMFHTSAESSGNFLYPYIWSIILENSLSPDTLRRLLSMTPSIPVKGMSFMDQTQLMYRKLYCVNQRTPQCQSYTLLKLQKHDLKSKIEAKCNVKRGKSRVLQLVGYMQCKNSIERILEGASHMLCEIHIII